LNTIDMPLPLVVFTVLLDALIIVSVQSELDAKAADMSCVWPSVGSKNGGVKEISMTRLLKVTRTKGETQI
jgi:hypothetical protein